MAITYHKGEIPHDEAQALVNLVSMKGHYESFGLASRMSEEYPEAFESLQDFVRQDGFENGVYFRGYDENGQLANHNISLHFYGFDPENDRWLINLPIFHPNHPINMPHLRYALRDLEMFCSGRGFKTVAMPQPGDRYRYVGEQEVRDILQDHLGGSDVMYHVYDRSGKKAPKW